MADKDSRTEKATPKKRRDERKQGNVPMSRDVTAVASLIAAYALLRIMAPTIVEKISNFMRYCIGEIPLTGLSFQGMLEALRMHLIGAIAATVGIFAAGVALVSIAATMAQTKLLVTATPLKPKLDRLNPINGFKKLFSLKGLIETAKSLVKIVLLLYLIYSNLMDIIDVTHKYLYNDIATCAAHVFDSVLGMIFDIIIAFTAVAAADYLYQNWEYERNIKMSKQEIKEEYKMLEGDPKIKGKIKERQRQMAMSRMMQQVPKADVVIKNPTHFAVALRYRPEVDNAPVVLALGQDEVALRIIAIAESNQVAVIENVPLARALYASSELNREIPPEFYGAVAEVLVYIFRLNDDKRLVK